MSFACRASKANKQGLSPVELVIVINGERSYLTLLRKENADAFAKATVSKKNNDTKEFCNTIYNKMQNYITEMIESNIQVSVENLRKFIQNGYSNAYTLEMLKKDFLEIIKKRDISLGQQSKYERVFDYINEYVDSKSDVNMISNSVVVQLRDKFSKEYENSTAVGYYSKLKSICQYAFNNGKMKVLPTANVKLKKFEKMIETINSEEFDRICSKDIKLERLDKVRDMFVFACHSGMAFCDCCALNKDDISEVNGKKMIIKERDKTGVMFYSILLPEAIKILEKYDYDLSALKISNQKTNSYLDEIQAICDITSVPSLHFHLARHFYATHLINSDLPIEIISKCLGHSNTRQTKHYAHLLKGTVERQITNAFDKVKV